jgi:hypothetical protein
MRSDHRHLTAYQVSCEVGQSIVLVLRPAILDRHILALAQKATFASAADFLVRHLAGPRPARQNPAYSISWSAQVSRVGDRDRASFCHSRMNQSCFARWIRWGPQLRVPAGVCTARQSVCVRSFSSIPQPPVFRLCSGAFRRRRWPLWRLVLELATDPVGVAAGLDL